MNLLDDNDARTLAITEPQEVAVEMLMDAIKKPADVLESGKWTIFLSALEETGKILSFLFVTIFK